MTRKFTILAGAAGLASIAGLAMVWASGDETTAGILPYTDAAAIAAGAEIYADACAACHGADLSGEPDWRRPKPSGRMPAPPHDQSGHTWHHPDTQLFLITKYGTSAMVAGGYQSDMIGFEDVLSDDQILAVLAYIKSTWPARVIETHNQINARASQ